MNKKKILSKVDKIYEMWKMGELGGEIMPEDDNPGLDKASKENYLFFTLPMALNYQRDSYKLWQSAKKTYEDLDTRFVFDPNECMKRDFEEVQNALTKYKVALQRKKQTEIWISLCSTFSTKYNGDIRNMFEEMDNCVYEIKNLMQKLEKKKFPYLSGEKICNYWLYVISQYTDRKYIDMENITVAPDTHIVQATYKLGLITDDEYKKGDVQLIVEERWKKLFEGTKYKPIDIHTPLWLWSRNGFKEVI